MNKKIVNPFHLLKPEQSSTSSAIESTSGSVNNKQHGVCPKCESQMTTSHINLADKSVEPVFWCGSCRVSVPKPTGE